MSGGTLPVGDEAALGRLAGALAPSLKDGGVVYLEGELGTGKTSFARGVLRALGECAPVKSPTYTLVEPYCVAGLAVYHFDLYRLGDPGEMEYLGVRDYFAPGTLCLIEWPERAQGWLPEPDLRVCIRVQGRGRVVELVPCSARAQSWVNGLALLK